MVVVVLCVVYVDWLVFYVVGVGYGDYYVFWCDQVQDVQVFFVVVDFGVMFVVEFGFDVDQFFVDYLQQVVGIFQDVDQFGDYFQQLFVFVGQVVLFQFGQVVQVYFQDLGGLDFGQLVVVFDQVDVFGQVFWV